MITSLWRRILPQRIANTGSQLRDHQANERTFLSWTRMGLGFAAMALALGRLDAIDRMIASALSSTKLNLVVLPEQPGQVMQTVPVRPGTATAPATASQARAPPASTSTSTSAPAPAPAPATETETATTGAPQKVYAFGSTGLSAATLCQGISVWSFGYGILRYFSVRQNVLRGQFTPAIWGPAFMTCGCLGLFGTMGVWMDRRAW